jgi:hypothetical protein
VHGCSQVYLPAIQGYVPEDMVRALRAFLEFCYISRRNVLDTNNLNELRDSLQRFHHYRKIFETTGVRKENRHPPRQHSLMHYIKLIRDFGAPNGLCSSITESKHIKAIKEPYRRSNRYEALGQMLITNQRIDKLAAAYVDFRSRGLLEGSIVCMCINFIFHCENSIGLNHFTAAANQEDEPTTTKNTSQLRGDSDSDDDGDSEVPGQPRSPSIMMSSKPLGRILS